MMDVLIRHVEADDYAPIIAVINDWWGGRAMSDMLPKLFFVHFRDTSFIAEAAGECVGFLIGFRSQTFSNEAYIHFVGVHPDFRKREVGKRLYEHFFDVVGRQGCEIVRCVTSPLNRTSIAFHTRMGFQMESQGVEIDGVPVYQNYDGQGEDRVLFYKTLP
jgi:ribosomal protein S18 acetylase RimI-like enzyme